MSNTRVTDKILEKPYFSRVGIIKERTSKGFTLMELAKKSGIGKSTLNNIENGKVSPTLFQLETIAIALEVKITDLFESEYK